MSQRSDTETLQLLCNFIVGLDKDGSVDRWDELVETTKEVIKEHGWKLEEEEEPKLGVMGVVKERDEDGRITRLEVESVSLIEDEEDGIGDHTPIPPHNED